MGDILIIRLLPSDDEVLTSLLDSDLQRIIDTSHPDSIFIPQRPQNKREADPRGVLCLGTLLFIQDNGTLAIRYLNKNEESLHKIGRPPIDP